MLTKTTRVYANHGMPLECDIYAAEDYPNDTPVLVYFHPGGLVDWGRDVIPPWLVQVCPRSLSELRAGPFTLMSICRLGLPATQMAAREPELPSPAAGWCQGTPRGCLRGVCVCAEVGRARRKDAACDFRRWKWRFASLGYRCSNLPLTREITGVFVAALIAHHCQPTPLALFSIEGINTFRHPFFNSSTLLTPEPIQDADMAAIIAGPVAVGATAPGAASAFRLEKLRADGSRNPDYRTPSAPAQDGPTPKYRRGDLYDYYTYKNGWLDLVGEVDPGYEWAKGGSPAARERVARWPPTVILHGNDDDDVPLGVSEQMRDCLGEARVSLFVADGQPHLYELTKFIDDEGPEMGAVKDAVKRLDEIVGSTVA